MTTRKGFRRCRQTPHQSGFQAHQGHSGQGRYRLGPPVRLVMKLAAGEQQQAASNADGSVAKMFAQATGSVLIFLPGVPEINRFHSF